MSETYFDNRIEQTYSNGQRFVWYQDKNEPEKLEPLTKEQLKKFKKIIDSEFLDNDHQLIAVE